MPERAGAAARGGGQRRARGRVRSRAAPARARGRRRRPARSAIARASRSRRDGAGAAVHASPSAAGSRQPPGSRSSSRLPSSATAAPSTMQWCILPTSAIPPVGQLVGDVDLPQRPVARQRGREDGVDDRVEVRRRGVRQVARGIEAGIVDPHRLVQPERDARQALAVAPCARRAARRCARRSPRGQGRGSSSGASSARPSRRASGSRAPRPRGTTRRARTGARPSCPSCPPARHPAYPIAPACTARSAPVGLRGPRARSACRWPCCVITRTGSSTSSSTSARANAEGPDGGVPGVLADRHGGGGRRVPQRQRQGEQPAQDHGPHEGRRRHAASAGSSAR